MYICYSKTVIFQQQHGICIVKDKKLEIYHVY